MDLDGDPGAHVVFLGDYVDRGPDSAGVLYVLRYLQQRYHGRVTVLQGNHDEWLLDWVFSEEDDASWLLADPGFVTLGSFLEQHKIEALSRDGSVAEINGRLRCAMRNEHGELIRWLQRQPLIFETDDQIFVHAGIDELAGAFWRAATPDYWFTEKYPASTGPFIKTIIAGHVRASSLHNDGRHEVFHDGASHFYIDGAVEITGQLNVLRYDCETGEYSWQMTPAPDAGDESAQDRESRLREERERQAAVERRLRRILAIGDSMWPNGAPASRQPQDDQIMMAAEEMGDLLAVPALPGEVQCEHGFRDNSGPHSCDFRAHGDRCPAES